MYVDFLQLTSAEVEKNRLSIDIIGLREVGWPESGKQKKVKPIWDVQILITDIISLFLNILKNKIILSSMQLCLILKQHTPHRSLNIAPTRNKSDDELKAFYTDIIEAIKLWKKGGIGVVIGNFNIKSHRNRWQI